MTDDPDITSKESNNLLEVKSAIRNGTGRSTIWLNLLGVGVILLGLAAILNSVDDWRDSRDLNQRIVTLNTQFTCRYVISQEAQEYQSQMSLELALGLAAFAQDDDEGLHVHTQRINEIAPDLQEALDQRSKADELCDSPRE